MSLIRLYYSLNASARNLPVANLEMDDVGIRLAECGLCSIGTLLKAVIADRKALEKLGRFSTQEIQLVQLRLVGLKTAMDRNGDLRLSPKRGQVVAPTHCGNSPPTTSPAPLTKIATAQLEATKNVAPASDVENGEDFVRAFSEVIERVIEARDNDADRMILVERLSRQPHERMTLDEIAKAIPRSISRERIRQREQKLLDGLASALLFDRGRKLGLYFRKSFRDYWIQAFEVFRGKEAVTFQEFMEGLQSAWGLRADQIYPHLPLVTSILTRRATIPEQIRNHLRRNTSSFRNVRRDQQSLPISRFPIGKAARELSAQGITTVGQLVDTIQAGSLNESPVTGKAIGRLLEELAVNCTDSASLEPLSGTFMGARVVPTGVRNSPKEFVESLAADVEELLGLTEISKRSLPIFQRRIAVDRSMRPTLEETATALSTHGSSVKREESVMLDVLNRYLAEQDLSEADVFVSSSFLAYWRQANEEYCASGQDVVAFRTRISDRWALEVPSVGLEILWAVLNQYPSGRPRRLWKHKPKLDLMKSVAPTPGIIVLRGFRRAH